MEPQLGAYHHTRLVNMLHQYYPELHAHVKYHNVEYLHPTEISYWKSDVVITKWDYRVGGQRVHTTYGHITRRADVYASMEDAAEEAYIFYHGKRFEHMEHDPYRHLPREEYAHGPWTMEDPGNADATLEAMVGYAHAQKVANDELKQEVSILHKAWSRAQKEIEDLRAQLALPPRYKKLYKEGQWYNSP
jgi:leucyl aminopeptidase (aminopeptidase T)